MTFKEALPLSHMENFNLLGVFLKRDYTLGLQWRRRRPLVQLLLFTISIIISNKAPHDLTEQKTRGDKPLKTPSQPPKSYIWPFLRHSGSLSLEKSILTLRYTLSPCLSVNNHAWICVEIFLKGYFIFSYVHRRHLCWACALWAGALRGRRLQIPVEPEIQTVVSHLSWVLGIKLGSSARTVSALHPWAISPAPECLSLRTPTLLHTDWVLSCSRVENPIFLPVEVSEENPSA